MLTITKKIKIMTNKDDLPFYKLAAPKLADFIDAIDSFEFFTAEQYDARKKQLKAYFLAKFEIPCITYVNITNSGGFPIIYDVSKIYETLQDVYTAFHVSEDEQRQFKELFFFNSRELL